MRILSIKKDAENAEKAIVEEIEEESFLSRKQNPVEDYINTIDIMENKIEYD